MLADLRCRPVFTHIANVNFLLGVIVLSSRAVSRLRRTCSLAVGTALACASLSVVEPAQAHPGYWYSPYYQSQNFSASPYLIGAGVGDVTGEPAEVGFMGYGDGHQLGSGVMSRSYARAFEIQDRNTGERNLMVVLDQLSAFQSVRDEVIRRVQRQYGDAYGESNIMITANHTHATPGGITKYGLYNVTTSGWHEDTFNATVEGIMDAIDAAHRDLAPGNLTVSHSQLTGVGVNRSMVALRNNPQQLQDKLIDGVDPTTVTLRLERDGKTRALINWFAIHPTSLPTTNTLISSDNKGYAQWLLENQDHGVDHYSGAGDGFIAAFANSNAGDVSPNTWLRPGKGPTDNPFQNMKIQGTKQADAVRDQLRSQGEPVGQGLGSAVKYFDFSNMTVDAQYTGTGKAERTCRASLGESFGSGSEEDGGGGLPIFGEGVGTNKFFYAMSRAAYNVSADLKACQYPKDHLLAVGLANAVQEKLPVQVMRFGDYYVLGLPGEYTGAVGVQYRQDMAKLFGVDESHIILQGYTNAYNHYVTTPEEYDLQQYEGGSTIFGRYEAPAFRQSLHEVGSALHRGESLDLGDKPQTPYAAKSSKGKVLYDTPGAGKRYGQQLRAPQSTWRGGSVSAEFVGAHPNNSVRKQGSYLEIQRWNGRAWEYVASDNDPNTRFQWKRHWASQSRVTISWDVPSTAVSGTYRILYYGHSKNGWGQVSAFTGTSSEFRVY